MIRVAINGYGRIGRIAHRVILEKFSQDIDIVAINAGSSTDLKGWMYLLQYDTAYHTLNASYNIGSSVLREGEKIGMLKDCIGYIIINNKKIPVFSQKDPNLLPWKDLSVDVVIESTGHISGLHHTTKSGLEDHIKAGAKAVVVSAPVTDSEVSTYVISVNEKNYNSDPIISNASCTTNCITPIAKIIEDHFGIEKAMITTIHGYTSDQRLEDGGHKDYRRARAAAQNIIPTSTGATHAAAQAFPVLINKFAGLAIRVPVPVGSLSDFTFVLKKEATKEEINDTFKRETVNQYKGIVGVTEDPLVSSDIIGDSHSAVVDLSLTQVVGGNMIKIIAWYDNEYGYANRLVEEVVMVGKKNN